MLKWEVDELGDPLRVVRRVEVAAPAAGAGQALMRIDAVGLGFPDFLMPQGLYHDKPPLPFGIGGESAATVVDSDIAGWNPGDRALLLAAAKGAGLLTELAAADPIQLLPIPQDMPAEHAAVMFAAYQTSYMALHRRAKIEAGETILIHGATGGVGMAAVQLSKAAGCQVIAVVGGERKVAAARELGADHVIDHTTTDFVAAVKELTDGRGVDVAYDPVGGEVFDKTRRVMAVEGRLLVIGFASGTIPQAPVNHALLKNYSIVGFRTRPFREDTEYRNFVHNDLMRLYGEGKIAPVTSTYDFDDVPSALAEIGGRQVIGRVVVRGAGEVRQNDGSGGSS